MADDFLNNPEEQGFPSELDTASPYSGNRPASGARRATPGEVLSQGFQGAQNAGDFLGLDTEFTASQDPNQGYGTPLDLVPPPTLGGDAGQDFDPGYAQSAVPEPAPLPEGDAVQEFAEAPSAFEFGEDLGSDEGEFAPLSEPVSSRKPMLVGVLVAAALGAGGLFYGPGLFSRYFGAKTEVAQAPSTKVDKPPRGETSAPLATESASVAPAVDALPTFEPVAATPTLEEPVPVVPSSALRGRETPTPVEEPPVPSVVETPPAGEDSPSVASLGALPSASSATFPDLAGPGFDWASEDRLELIWRGSEVPLEAVKAPAKTIMPRVGSVRVFTTTGDVFDGRLYAVGQNRVWLDTEPGRVGLDGDKVERIEVLPPLPEGTKSSGDPGLLAGGKRVRVRVPGGVLYGHVLKLEGEDVTLALTDGGRVRVKSSDLEDLGPGRAVVVGR